MSKILITWDSNWADEMDISGFVIVTEEESKDYRKRLNDKENFSLCVGTNEEIDYDSGSDLLEELSFVKISDDEAIVIEKRLGSEYGFTEFYNQVNDDYEQDDEDEDDW